MTPGQKMPQAVLSILIMPDLPDQYSPDATYTKSTVDLPARGPSIEEAAIPYHSFSFFDHHCQPCSKEMLETLLGFSLVVLLVMSKNLPSDFKIMFLLILKEFQIMII